jgi:hypothetical protein
MAHDWIVQLAASTSASGQGLEVGLWRVADIPDICFGVHCHGLPSSHSNRQSGDPYSLLFADDCRRSTPIPACSYSDSADTAHGDRQYSSKGT